MADTATPAKARVLVVDDFVVGAALLPICA